MASAAVRTEQLAWSLPNHLQLPESVESSAAHPGLLASVPNHLQLPASDGSFVKNMLEHPQSILLTDSIDPVLQRRHPQGDYAIGQDLAIYWRLTEPVLAGAAAPDWFYVAGVPGMLEGRFRRSYVRWQEIVSPLVILEFVSGDGSEARDRTPWKGKFWVYECAIRAGYGIYEVVPGRITLYRLEGGGFELVAPDEYGRYPIAPLGVSLGIWHGRYLNLELPWLRWWDTEGRLLLTGHERAQQEQERAQRLAAQLRALGVEPDEPGGPTA